jgi:predicted metalloprotease with PDZ domain
LFGYNSEKQLSVKDISTTSIEFESPVLVDDLGTKITDYILLYGKHSFDELLSDPALLSSFTEVSFSPQGNENTLTMTLNSNLDANAVYYVVAIPRDDWDML